MPPARALLEPGHPGDMRPADLVLSEHLSRQVVARILSLAHTDLAHRQVKHAPPPLQPLPCGRRPVCLRQDGRSRRYVAGKLRRNIGGSGNWQQRGIAHEQRPAQNIKIVMPEAPRFCPREAHTAIIAWQSTLAGALGRGVIRLVPGSS